LDSQVGLGSAGYDTGPSKRGGQVIIEFFHVAVHESRAPERAQGLGPRLGLAGWSFFLYLFELRNVRP
jgi:hypothetical protein